MKKRVLCISLPLLIVAAVASVPYWIGVEVEDRFLLQTKNLQQQLFRQHGVMLEILRYRRGYLTAVADTQFTFGPQAVALLPTLSSQTTEPVTMMLRHQISYGPWIDKTFSQKIMSKVETTLVASNEQQAALDFYFPDQPAFSSTTWLEWSGAVNSHGGIPAYSGRDHSGQYDVQWGGLHFEFDGNWVALRGHGRFNSPRFELSNASHGVTIGGLSGEFSRLIAPSGLSLGDGKLMLNTFKIRAERRNGSPQRVLLRDIAVAHHTSQRKQVVDLQQQFDFRLLQLNGEQFNNGSLHIELSSLDAEVLQSLQRRYEQMTKMELADPVLLRQVWLQEAQQVLPALLVQGPVIHISKAEVTTGTGAVSARLKVAIRHDTPTPELTAFPAGWAALLPYIEIEFDITLPESMIVQQARKAVREKIVERLQETAQTMTPELLSQQTERAAEQMLTQFEIQKILRHVNRSFQVMLRYREGHLYLNGLPADHFLSMLPPLKEG